MRRYIDTRPGRAVSFLVVYALLLPFLTLGVMRPAQAQLESLPTWAVVDFANLGGKGDADLGARGAEAFRSELAKTNKYDVLPSDTVKRVMDELGIQAPVRRSDELIRLGQNLRAQTIVSGEIVNWRVVNSGNGKRADVLLRIEVRDVASGLSVNGTALAASSSERTGDVAEATLVGEALAAAAFSAVKDIEARTLPNATVLNTLEREALINQGTRVGFQKGQEVIVTRGREQVATASVTNVEPDSATIRVARQIKGIQPGDKVRVIFTVPTLKPDFTDAGGAKVVKPRPKGNNSGLIAVLLVLGVLVVLLGQGRGSNNDVITDVKAEAVMLPDDTPAVRISWRPDGFVKGNQQRFRWQVFRSDAGDLVPVVVADGRETSVVDDARGRTFQYANFNGVRDGFTCTFTESPDEDGAGTGVVAGTPYTYSVELVYKVSRLDLPGEGGGGTGGGGTTTGTTTGTTGTTTGGSTGLTGMMMSAEYEMAQTTGTTTGGTGTTSGDAGECFFVSKRTGTIGQATPFVRPQLRTPEDEAIVDPNGGGTPFTFTSVKGAVQSVVVEYMLQFSDDPNFPAGRTINVLTLTSSAAQNSLLSTPPVGKEALSAFPGAPFVYWRIGAKNLADNPGPVPVNGNRYIFSGPNRFKRPVDPPLPPAQ